MIPLKLLIHSIDYFEFIIRVIVLPISLWYAVLCFYFYNSLFGLLIKSPNRESVHLKYINRNLCYNENHHIHKLSSEKSLFDFFVNSLFGQTIKYNNENINCQTYIETFNNHFTWIKHVVKPEISANGIFTYCLPIKPIMKNPFYKYHKEQKRSEYHYLFMS